MPELHQGLTAAITDALGALPRPPSRLVVALSGGLDSTLLLHLARQVARERGLALAAVHVHHGLSPQADAWAAQVVAGCATLGVPCEVRRITVDLGRPSREAAARDARHAALNAALLPGDVLLLAHHADDQAETLLLRLLRGSGIAGLSAMRAARPVPGVADAWLLRPWLDLTRAQLHAVASALQLSWVEDESNADTGFDRNFLRHEVLPRLRARWPATTPTLAATARRLAAADGLLNEYLDAEMNGWLQEGTPDTRGRATLDAAALRALGPEKRVAMLRRWLSRIGAPLFSEAWLREVAALASARIDAESDLRVGGWELHRFRDRLIAFPALPPAPAGLSLDWDGRVALALGEGGGVLVRGEAGGDGLALSLPPGASLQVRFRAGGERILPSAAGHRPLKKVLQDLGVPPWLRSRAPLLYVDGQLAAVGDLLADQAFLPGPSRPETQRLCWQRP